MPTLVTDRELRGSDFRVGISPQAVKGVIDTSPVFTPVRRREGVGSKVVTYTEDPTVNSRMQAAEQVQESQDLTAELSASFVKQSVDWLIQAIHANEVAVSTTAVTIAATATAITSSASSFGGYKVGDGIWVSGFDNPLLNRFYIVTAATAGSLTTSPPPAAVEAAGETVTVITRRSVSADAATYNAIQTRATDLSAAGGIDYYTQFDSVINTFSFEIPETGIVTASAGFVSQAEVAGNDAIAGQTYAAEQSDRAVSARKGSPSPVIDFYSDGTTATCSVKSLTVEVNNNYAKDSAAGCVDYYTRGQFQVSGSAVIRSRISDPFDWRDKSWNGTRTSIGVRLGHGGGDETYIIMRQTVITEATMPNGQNVAANTEISFSAEEYMPTNTTIEVYRNWQ